MRILIADDDALIRRVLISVLGKLGYALEVAKDGNEALTALLQPDPPHIAILDCKMPGLGGLEVCRRLRSQLCQRETYVMLLTALDSRNGMLEGIAAGADSYMTKPFDVEKLRAHVGSVMRAAEKKNSDAERLGAPDRRTLSPRIITTDFSDEAAWRNCETGIARTLSGSASMRSTRPSGGVSSLGPFSNGAELLADAFRGMGIGGVRVDRTSGSVAPNVEVELWSVLILPQQELWVDLTLETDHESASRLYRCVTKNSPVDPRRSAEGVAEILNVVQNTFRDAFQREGIHAIAPTFPHAITPARLAPPLTEARQMARYRFAAHGISFYVTVSPHHTPSEKRAPVKDGHNDRACGAFTMPDDDRRAPMTPSIRHDNRPLGEPQRIDGNFPDWRLVWKIRRTPLTGESFDE